MEDANVVKRLLEMRMDCMKVALNSIGSSRQALIIDTDKAKRVVEEGRVVQKSST